MKIGLLKDIKKGEYRTVITPLEAATIVNDGHELLVETGAGAGAGFPDTEYIKSGAEILKTGDEIWANAELITKVKEIEESEFDKMREGQIIVTCLHPAAHPSEVEALLKNKVIAFTAEDAHRYGSPNCESAGKQGVICGLESMSVMNGGKGKFIGGLAGAPSMSVLVLGAGVVGKAAISVLVALGARVTVLANNMQKLRDLKHHYNEKIDVMVSTQENIKRLLPTTDMLLNCVRWPKGAKPYLVTKEMLKLMEPGSVLVDISNDEDGAIESFHETTHEDPRYIVNGVVHYCVSNIPSAMAMSTSQAYAAVMLKHFRNIANNGVRNACINDGYLRRSLVSYDGYLTHEETSALQGIPWIRPEDILGISNLDLDFAPENTVTRSENFVKIK
ncbi:alanine dehydrogenase [Anaerovoracaceae bacterium SGI.195]|nr:alanine dehydrogenase [Anaerovoracaceae bacterium]